MEPESQSQFERLKVSLSEYRAREPKARQALDAKAKRAIARQVAAALSDGAPVLDVVGEAQLLPATLIAEGIAEAWPKLRDPDRQKLVRWVGSVAGDKRASLATRLAALFLAGDEPLRTEAVGMLLLAPDNKEAVVRLGADFLGPDGSTLDRLKLPEAAGGGTTLAQRLLRAAKTPKVQEYRRVKALQLVLGWMVTREGIPTSERLDLVTLAREVRKELTEVTSTHMSRWLEQHLEARRLLEGTALEAPPRTSTAAPSAEASSPVVDVTAEPRLSPSPSATAAPPVELRPAGPASAEPHAPGSAEASKLTAEDPVALVLERVAALKAEASALEILLARLAAQAAEVSGLQQRASEITRAVERARSESDESEARVAAVSEECKQLQQRVQAASADRDSTAARLTEAESAHRIAEASAQKDRAQWANDRATLDSRIKELETRVQATAEMRLEELRNRIAAAVTKATRQVPERRSTLTAEQAVVVLARFYEVIEALDDNGVKVG